MNKEPPYLPTIFRLYISDFKQHISVWLDGNELQYTSEGETSVGISVSPTDSQWMEFWRKCDELDIWSWRFEYILNRWEEGYKWGVEIEYGERHIKTCGISMYPCEIDLMAPLNHESLVTIQVDTWKSFTLAVKELLGDLPFIWTDWRPYDFPTHEQTIRNELTHVMKHLPAEPRDGILNDLVVSIVDVNLGWFQLRIELSAFCVFADTDHTMTPMALCDLINAVAILSNGSETVFIDFDNECADTARIIMMSDGDGLTRLTIVDWCEKRIDPRLDIEAPTATVIRRFQDAVSNYAATTDVELIDLIPAYCLKP